MVRKSYSSLLPIICIILFGFVTAGIILGRTVTVFSENATIKSKHCVVIDAGHGGVDGGATSCSGILESHMNLEIAKRLNDMLRILGVETKMIRETDISIFTSGNTIAEKKISDLKNRVEIVNGEENGILISIHMNYFTDSRYSGAQVFYAPTEHSKELASKLQSSLNGTLKPTTNRQIKKADGIYLMQHIQCPAVLVECGFISNFQENALLSDPRYQQKLCGILATNICTYLSNA